MPLVRSGSIPDHAIMPLTHGRSILRISIGALVGLVLGAIVSLNVVIFSGIDDGYEASIPDVFDENAFVGVIAIVVLIAGPVIGVIIALRESPPR